MRASHTVVQPDGRGVGLARRTAPLGATLAAIAVWALAGQLFEILCGFAFLPSSRVLTNHEVVRRMHNGQRSAVCRRVRERNRRRLVVILDDAGVVLQLVNERQLDAVTLELNGYAHL